MSSESLYEEARDIDNEEGREPTKFMLNLHAENSAFSPDPAVEVVRILRATADRIEREGLSGFFETILDANGNDVGRFALKPWSYR